MSRANRQKRQMRDVVKRLVTDAEGHRGTLYVTPDSWLEMDSVLPDEVADHAVAAFRAAGITLWLHADAATGTVRTRMQFPLGSQQPNLAILQTLSKYARALGKAVARSGDFNPPPGNAFGDTPLPPGGHWEWDGD